MLSHEPIEIYMDAATYPIARWSAEHWAGKGVPLLPFPRHDAAALGRLLGRRRARPLVLCDGVCAGSNSQPPLAAYAALAHRHGGWLVIDDTQGLGVFGSNASPSAPYGLGGGGSLQRHAIGGDHVVVGASLAKGFGVPVALLAGSSALLRRFERASASREHMSPPSMAAIQASRHALAVNRRDGDGLRLRLWRAVQRLGAGLDALGVAVHGGAFPVQTLTLPGTDVRRLHRELLHGGVRTVLHDGRRGEARLSFIVNACHRAADIDRAVGQLSLALKAVGSGTSAASTSWVETGRAWSHEVASAAFPSAGSRKWPRADCRPLRRSSLKAEATQWVWSQFQHL